MYTNILLAFDGSLESRNALKEGADLAEKCGAVTQVLAVVRSPTHIAFPEGVYPIASITAEQNEARDLVQEGVERLRERGLTTHGYLGFGEPADQIRRMVEGIRPDLVVVGHHRRGLLERWWQSSVSQSLLNSIDCSLLIAVIPDHD